MADGLDRDVKYLARKLSDISQNAVTKADYAALKKTAARIKTQAVREVAAEVNIPQKHIRKRMFIRVKINRNHRQGRITGYRRDIPLIRLGTAQVALNQGGGGKILKIGSKSYPGAFVNRIRKTGDWQVMQRIGKKRYPVKVLKIDIARAVDRSLPRKSRQLMSSEYPKLLKHELNYRLSRYARKT